MTPENRRTVAELLAALCDRPLSPDEMRQLDSLVCTDAEARRLYVEYLDLHARLSYQFHRPAENDECGMMNDELPSDPTRGGVIPPVHHSSFRIHHSFLTGALCSYAVAALLLGTAILAAWSWPAPVGRDAVSIGRNAAPLDRPAESRHQILATLTPLNECQWANPDPVAEVTSGQIVLTSGLLEIAYNSGVKVILQGPVSYQVASPNAGFLRWGKATVRVPEKGPRFRVQGSGPAADRSSVAADSRLFTLHAPNIVVTDHGGELGLWIDDAGDSHAYVFYGHVDLQLSGQSYAKATLLRKNCWAWVKRAPNGSRTMLCGQGEPTEHFARQMPIQPPVAADTKKPGLGPGEHIRIYHF